MAEGFHVADENKKRKVRTGRFGGRPDREMKRSTLYLVESDIEAMKEIAQREGLLFADIVRRACRELVEREEAKAKRKP